MTNTFWIKFVWRIDFANSSRCYRCADGVDTGDDAGHVWPLVSHPPFQYFLLQPLFPFRAFPDPSRFPSRQVGGTANIVGKIYLLTYLFTSGMLKEQTNWRDHRPGNLEDDNGPPPIFIPMKSGTWLWVTIPFAFYLVDWSWRKFSRRQSLRVTRTVVHEPNVIELVFDRWISHSQSGQVQIQFSRVFIFWKCGKV